MNKRLKHQSIVYFMLNNNIVKGKIAAAELYPDEEYGLKYMVELDEAYVHEGEDYYFLSVPETELYKSKQEILEQG